MNKTTLAIVGVILLVIIAVAVGLTKNRSAQTVTPSSGPETSSATTQSTSPAISPTHDHGKDIVYTDSGFSPATVTIKVGQMVAWTNNSSRSMWVATDPHPAHTQLSGFDAEVGASPGGTYNFTFTKAGTWTYHNHLNPGDHGTIIVENR